MGMSGLSLNVNPGVAGACCGVEVWNAHNEDRKPLSSCSPWCKEGAECHGSWNLKLEFAKLDRADTFHPVRDVTSFSLNFIRGVTVACCGVEVWNAHNEDREPLSSCSPWCNEGVERHGTWNSKFELET